MSKTRPLPPRRSDDSPPRPVQSENPVAGPPLPRGGSSTTGRLAAIVEQLTPRPPRMEACSTFCPADADRFNQLSDEMKRGGWELVTVLPHMRFTFANGESGKSNGWMTFWRRAEIKHEE